MPGEGACEPGSRRGTERGDCAEEELAEELCTDACAWEPTGVCVGPCGPLRTEPADAEEVCVPAGEFIRGLDDDVPRIFSPQRTVFVSTYAMDVYPVTNRRYRECRDAGGCTGTLREEGEANLANDDRQDYFVMQVTWEQAMQFCEWDGGRRLPTEAEWEKAGRGPAPRDQVYPWGDTYDCDRFPAASCETMAVEVNRPIGRYPATVGFYGTHDMLGNGNELVYDLFGRRYYEDDDSLHDPFGPPVDDSDLGHVVRSFSNDTGRMGQLNLRLISRAAVNAIRSDTAVGPTFRCVKSEVMP